MSADKLRRFLFEEAAVRGEVVQLDAAWRAVLERHPYPPAVQQPLGELITAGALLAATLKFDGSIILQITGEGPIHMLIAEIRPQQDHPDLPPSYRVRGVARWHGEVPHGSLSERCGSGHLIITIDPGSGANRYQGIVELSGDTLGSAIAHYLERSEQLATRIWLAVEGERAGGLLLQRLPGQEGDDESWERLQILADTVTARELTDLDSSELVRRLFHEETVRLFDQQPVQFGCHCSRTRVADTLRGMGRAEVDSIIAEQGAVEVTCQFCNTLYRFDSLDVEQIFAEETPQPDVGPTRH